MDRRQFLRLAGKGLIGSFLPALPVAAGNSGPNVKVWEGRMTDGEPDVEVFMEMYQFYFKPSTLTVDQGDRVRLYLTAEDVAHGISIDGYPVDVIVHPGTAKTLEFTASRTGSYRYRCAEKCGYFHPFMIGKLTVKPNWRFSGTLAGSALAGLGVLAGLGWREVNNPSSEREEDGRRNQQDED